MALKLEEIRALADRVAASHGLDVVDVEYLGGGGKHRTLRVSIEKNAAERAKLRLRVERLLAERADRGAGEEANEPDTANEPETEPGETAWSTGGFDPPEGPVSAEYAPDEDDAFLDGLPSVTNLELLSGITHEDCEVFSRDFGMVLDVEELVPGTEYLLEVSSPGLDRRLTRIEEYERFRGSLVKLQTAEPVDGNRHWQGRIASVHEGRLVLDLAEVKQGSKAKKGSTRAAVVELTVGQIEKAQLVPEF